MIKYGYDFYIVAGFLTGSILFGRLIPMLLYGKDVEKESEDGNPGTFNAFVCGGVFCGTLVLLADNRKGTVTRGGLRQTAGNGFLEICPCHGGACFWTRTLDFPERPRGKSNRGFFRRADRTVSGKPSAAASDRLLSSFCGCDPCKIKYKKKRICFFAVYSPFYIHNTPQNNSAGMYPDVGDRSSQALSEGQRGLPAGRRMEA